MRTFFLSLLVCTAAVADEQPTFLARDAKLEKLWNEGEFTEGPTPGPDGKIYFSDIGNRIMRFDPKTKKTDAFRDPSGRSNGLKFNKVGELFACEGANSGGNRRISITTKTGIKTLVDKYDGKKFNSPNDLTFDSKGRLYFTDPRYVGKEDLEIDGEYVYMVTDLKVIPVIKDITKPNGLVISPDGKTLYLAAHDVEPKGGRQLLAYPLKEDGSVGPKMMLYDFKEERGIDGMTCAGDGTIVATAGRGKAAGIYYFNPEGKVIGFLPTPESPSNCCFAGPGSNVLYITAGKSLYRATITLSAAK